MQWWQEHEMLKAAREELKKEQALSGAAGTHFTCFTSTYSVYLLYFFTTQREELKKERAQHSRRCSVYLLYWYKSTNTDAYSFRKRQREEAKRAVREYEMLLSLFALLVQKYKY
jgi:hypothetical protein